MQEANVHRFYYKQQRPTSDCFNLGKILREVSGISRVSENHARQELNRMKASYKILCPGPIQGEGIERDCLLEESEKERTVPPKVTPVRKEQHFKNLLRRKMMSCYDLGPAMKPFDAIEGESLSSLKNYCSGDFSQRKQEIFPFAVPYFRLPLLPSSRNELVKVSQILTVSTISMATAKLASGRL